MMTRLLEQLLSDAVYCVASRIRYAACNVGDINQIIQQTVFLYPFRVSKAQTTRQKKVERQP